MVVNKNCPLGLVLFYILGLKFFDPLYTTNTLSNREQKYRSV